MQFYEWEEGRWTRERQKIDMSYQIIIALDLTPVKVIGVVIIVFSFRFHSIVTEGSINVKFGSMPSHKMKRLLEGLRSQR